MLKEVNIMIKVTDKTKILVIMGLIALGLLWTSACKKSASDSQLFFADTDQSEWDLNNAGSSEVIEVLLKGEGIQKILLDSIEMIGDKPGAAPLKASAASIQDNHVRAEFTKNQVANILTTTSLGSKHLIVISFKGMENDEKTELTTQVTLGDEIPLALALEIAPSEWDLNYYHSSGTVKAFIRGIGYDRIDLATIIMKADNPTAVPLPALNATRQGTHVRAEFPKSQVLSLLLNPMKGSRHTIIINLLEIGGTEPVELSAQITVTDGDEGEEPGALALQLDPAEWDLNFVKSSGKVQSFIRGEGIEKIDLTTIRMKGDNPAAAALNPETVDLNGDHIRASFPKNLVIGLLNNPTEGSQHIITVTYMEIGGTVPIELTATIIVTDEDGDDLEPGELTLQVSPLEWNLNYYKSTGTVSAFIRGAGIENIDLTTIQLKGDNTAAIPLISLSAKFSGDHVRATFPKNQVLGLLLEPVSGSQHTVTVGFTCAGALKELTAVITVVGKAAE